LLIPYTGSVNYQFRILEGTKVAKLQSCKVAKTKRVLLWEPWALSCY